VIAARDGRLCALEFDGGRLARAMARRYPGARPPAPAIRSASARALCAYLAGDLTALDPHRGRRGGTPFQRRVWRALRRIPPGRTESYGALARRLGVGSACPRGRCRQRKQSDLDRGALVTA
jgi:methylated-DNA-[protein]-cysteine S-methyltransferase